MAKRIVFLQGAFDILNWGHVKAFELAKSYGDYLIIGLNTNELLRNYKQCEPVLPWDQKAFIIRSIKYVDKVVPAPAFSPIELLRKHKVDVYCVTEEWLPTKKCEIKYIESRPNGIVKLLPRFKGVVTTLQIKQKLVEEARNGNITLLG